MPPSPGFAGEGGTGNRPAFTLLEVVIALGVLAVAAVAAARLGTWTLGEREFVAERLAAAEGAANVLEAARGRSWADLTPEWAAGQRLSDDLADRLDDAALTVRVEPEADRPRVKRVTVDLHWRPRTGPKEQTVTLVGLFADRTAGGGS